ncbi:MAG: MFS transporter [Gammaproteobacteria bacterium]|nr:MFS transporter [Gammaproteobacteria bacterium]
MPIIISKKLVNTRLLTILLLGFSSGLPITLIGSGSTLQAWFTKAQVGLASIGLLSLLGLPHALKFLWAPFMDYFALTSLGKRKSWILLTQFSLFIMLMLLANMDPALQAGKIGLVILLIAFFSASQDIAVDAYRTDILAVEERGLGAAYYVFAYRIATLCSGGLALVCADYFGWKVTYEIMAIVLFCAMLPTYLAPKPIEIIKPTSIFHTITASFYDLLQREKLLILFLFILFYKLGDALALSLVTHFLLQGLGFSLTEVGLAYKAVSIIATILGSFIGGILLIRWNIYRSLLVFGLAQAFSNLTFALLAAAGKHFLLMTTCIFIENFCSGLSTIAFMAFLMSLCDRRYTAGQYALLSAIASCGRIFLGPLAALMVNHLGWVQFYIWSFILSFPGIFFLVLLKNRVLDYAPAIADY